MLDILPQLALVVRLEVPVRAGIEGALEDEGADDERADVGRGPATDDVVEGVCQGHLDGGGGGGGGGGARLKRKNRAIRRDFLGFSNSLRWFGVQFFFLGAENCEALSAAISNWKTGST